MSQKWPNLNLVWVKVMCGEFGEFGEVMAIIGLVNLLAVGTLSLTSHKNLVLSI